MAQDSPEHGKHYNIFVNARKKDVAADTLSYADVVGLAYDGNPPSGENVVITVAYSKGEHNASGTLIAGQSVNIKSGMVFNVTATDRS